MTPDTCPTLTTSQMVEVDRLMIEVYGIQLIQMMENAGRNLAEMSRRMIPPPLSERHILVVCGQGNNGGGGMVAARHLHNRGARVTVILPGDPARLKPIPAHQWHILQAMAASAPGALEILTMRNPPANLPAADLIVDALIGYGLKGNPRPQTAAWIAALNAHPAPILALDAPSGLDTTTGAPATPCVRAAATLTLALPKTGLLTPQARPVVGDLYLADISVPPELYRHLGLDVPPLFVEDTIRRWRVDDGRQTAASPTPNP
ncbi:MAG: hypothetical protein Fur0018_11380 [Anaerolineales bacterium]